MLFEIYIILYSQFIRITGLKQKYSKYILKTSFLLYILFEESLSYDYLFIKSLKIY